MKLQILAITLFSIASLYPSQQNQSSQPARTVAQILNDVCPNPRAIVNPHNLQNELIAADLADGREPLDDPRRDTLALACILVRQN